MIPQKIHYCWFGGTGLRPLHLKCIDSWKKFHPDWEFVFWNETNSPIDIPVIAQALKDRRWNYASDWVRLWALREHGGIYLDTDIELLQSLEPLRADPCFLGFQSKERIACWLNCAVFGSVAGHPFLGKLWDRMILHNPIGEYKKIQPEAVSDIMLELGVRHSEKQTVGDVVLYPHTYFYPYSWLQVPSPSYILPNTIAVHHWEGTWISPKDRAKFLIKRWLNFFKLRYSKF